MRKQQLTYAILFFVFATVLDAYMTLKYGSISSEYNSSVKWLANFIGFDLAVILWSALTLAVFITISLLMFRFGLATTSFILLVVLSVFHLQGALSWIYDLHEWFRIPIIIVVCLFGIFDLIAMKRCKT